MDLQNFIISLWPTIPVLLINKIIFKHNRVAIILTLEFMIFWIFWKYKSNWELQQNAWKAEDDAWWANYHRQQIERQQVREWVDVIQGVAAGPSAEADPDFGILYRPSYERGVWVPEEHGE